MTSRRRREKENATRGPGGIPKDAVLADRSQQVPNNSYDFQTTYDVDVDFTCCDCGAEQTWTAAQQKWYYEVAKGPLYATAIRCRPCRQKAREEKERRQKQSHSGEHGSRHSINSLEGVLSNIQSTIEASMLTAGFKYDGRNNQRSQFHLYLDYSRADALLRVCLDMRNADSTWLTAELLREREELDGEEIVTVASVGISDIGECRPPNDTMELWRRVDEFTKTVTQFFEDLAVTAPNPNGP